MRERAHRRAMWRASMNEGSVCCRYGHGHRHYPHDQDYGDGYEHRPYQQQYHGGATGYNNPYHESPIDLTKYDDELNMTETTDKSDGNCLWAATTHDRDVTKQQKDKKSKSKGDGKPPVRRLATGCAANFEIFGHMLPQTIALLN
jgi:hypothetical protein